MTIPTERVSAVRGAAHTQASPFAAAGPQQSRPPVAYDRRPVAELLASAVGDHGDLLAVEDGQTGITYRELDERADRLAQHLVAAGAEVGDMIGVCVGRSIAQIVAVIAVVKAGSVVVPLDPAYPADRVAFMLADSGAGIVVTTAATSGSDLEPVLRQARSLPITSDGAPIELCPTADVVNRNVSVQAPVYMIYTSGSTGRPKGTTVSHTAIANLLAWHRRSWLSEPGTRVLLYSPISFDVAFHEIFAGLATGATLVVVDEDTRSNPMALLEFARARRIQKWYMPFVALQQIAQAATTGQAPTDLVELIVGGEILRITPAIREFARRSGTVIHNHYGSTECIDVATHELAGDPSIWPAVAPVGRASVDNMALHILDSALAPVDAGQVGEIYCEGDSLAEGYHGRPGLTAQRFVANPFSPAGSRLYRMGDLGRDSGDGVIECVGRADTQLKIRGFRIEPGEIEAALAEHAAVAECAVVAAEGAHGNARLLAYVVPVAGAGTADLGQRLRQHAAATLPDHLVPAVVHVVAGLPLTPSGKLDRKALPALSTAAEDRPGTRPLTEAADVVTRIWRELLEVTDVDPDASFTDLGADSLMLVHAHQRIEAACGQTLPANLLFRKPTIHAVSRYLSGGEHTRPATPATRTPTAGDDTVAIVGMACRVPGADSIHQFWLNLCGGVESIAPLTSAELAALPAEQTRDPHFVAVAAQLTGIEDFDAEFFGISPAEAAVTDPQHRLFLETAVDAVEDAGLATDRVAVFAGSAMSTYLVNNVLPAVGPPVFLSHRNFDRAVDLRIEQGNAGDHLPMRTSHLLGLRGPSINVQATCATSLVAVHLARQALLAGECDTALAGGVSIITPKPPDTDGVTG